MHVGPDAAMRMVMGIIESVVNLASQPRSGVKREEFGVSVRMFPTGRFLIYYRPYRGGIQVIHVFDGSRDQPGAWSSESSKS
jgi:plasmid stabilization system protein ParE